MTFRNQSIRRLLGESGLSAREQLKANMMAELEGHHDEPNEAAEPIAHAALPQRNADLKQVLEDGLSSEGVHHRTPGAIALNDDEALARRALGH